MALPFVPIAIGAGVLSLGATIHSTIKKKKWQKLHNEALSKAQQTEKGTLEALERMNSQAESLGKLCVQELNTLRRAAEHLEKARVKDRNPIPELVEIPEVQLENWKTIHGEAIKSIGMGAAGTAGVYGTGAVTAAGLYTAAGIFGTASTGVRIATLSGAAAHSARMAWLGGGALTAGGAGMAGGLAALMTAANVVMTPIALASGFWMERQASKFRKQVVGKLREFVRFETKMKRKDTLATTACRRMDEKETSVRKLAASLKETLRDADPGDHDSAYGVYLKAKALSEALDSEILTPEQVEELSS